MWGSAYVTNPPLHAALLAAVPTTSGVRSNQDLVVDGDAPDPHEQPIGCPFHPRCQQGPRIRPERTVCFEADPHADAATRLHQAACHFAPTA